MGPALLAAVAALALHTSAVTDTQPTFATPATRALVERAMARHRAQDSAVADYRARSRYRASFELARGRWDRGATLGVEEQELALQWRAPNDLRIDVLGRRTWTRTKGMELSSVFTRPWFVPRAVGDSVRILGGEVGATAALHPLAADGPSWYRYAIVDSLRVTVPGSGGPLRIYAVEARPAHLGAALTAGRLWIDAASGTVVRWTFRYVGTALWARPEGATRKDSTAARRLNGLANRLLGVEADLEYALQDGRVWMPWRQSVSGTVEVPLVGTVVGFEALTTFRDYAIDTGAPLVFTVPLADTATRAERRIADGDTTLATLGDSALRARREERRRAREHGDMLDSLESTEVAGRWPAGRYEIHRPSNDSLARYRGWTDSLRVELAADDARRIRTARADLARLTRALPDELTGQRAHGFGYERIGDAAQFNRVQGFSLGAGYRVRLPVSFTNLYGTVRYGFGDERVTGRLSAVRDGPEARLVVSVYRDVLDADPLSPGRTLANSAKALFTAHDDADYYLADGGASVALATPLASGLDLELTSRVERQRSVARAARSAVNDWLGGTGELAPNPPIAEGTFVGGRARLIGVKPFGWTLAADVLGGGPSGAGGGRRTTGRTWGTVRLAFGGTQGATLRLAGGLATRDPLPQMAFRAGGPATVRGFEYGTQRGQGFWATQLDMSLLKGGGIRPVVFVDAGRAGAAADLFHGDVLVGGGVGVSLYSSLLRTSLLRIDVSRQLTPVYTRRLRLDLAFQAPR